MRATSSVARMHSKGAGTSYARPGPARLAVTFRYPPRSRRDPNRDATSRTPGHGTVTTGVGRRQEPCKEPAGGHSHSRRNQSRPPAQPHSLTRARLLALTRWLLAHLAIFPFSGRNAEEIPACLGTGTVAPRRKEKTSQDRKKPAGLAAKTKSREYPAPAEGLGLRACRAAIASNVLKTLRNVRKRS